MKSVIWRSEAGRLRLEQWYERFQSKVTGGASSRSVPTRFGSTHVLQAGNPGGPPLLCLHAMRTGAPFLLSELGPLLTRYRLIAPDLPGQSVRGLDKRLSLKDDSHANWLVDILDRMELDSVYLFGVSWGGFVARCLASHAPLRVKKLAMLVPAGIANGSHLVGLAKMLGPMIRYKMRPSETNLRALLAPILTTWEDDWAGATECSIRDMKMDYRIPPLASDQELKSLELATLVLAAEDDISFPGHAVVERVRRHLPTVDAEVIAECKHCPPTTDEFREWLAGRLDRFFVGS